MSGSNAPSLERTPLFLRPCTATTMTSRGLCPTTAFGPVFSERCQFSADRIGRSKSGAGRSALFVVNRFSLKSITIGKRRNILSCAGGKTFKPVIAHDAGITGSFDEDVFKTKFEAERPISFIFPGYDCPSRVDILKALGLRDRGIDPEHDQNR